MNQNAVLSQAAADAAAALNAQHLDAQIHTRVDNDKVTGAAWLAAGQTGAQSQIGIDGSADAHGSFRRAAFVSTVGTSDFSDRHEGARELTEAMSAVVLWVGSDLSMVGSRIADLRTECLERLVRLTVVSADTSGRTTILVDADTEAGQLRLLAAVRSSAVFVSGSQPYRTRIRSGVVKQMGAAHNPVLVQWADATEVEAGIVYVADGRHMRKLTTP